MKKSFCLIAILAIGFSVFSQGKYRLSAEIDEKLGVQGIIRKQDIIDGKLEPGHVYRIYDMVYVNGRYDDNSFVITVQDFPFSRPTPEFIITGNELLNADVRKTYSNEQFYRSAYGKVGYVVRYIGTRQVLTGANLVKIVHAFEFIGGNSQVEFIDAKGESN